MEVARSIKLSTNESAVVEFYPDELPADVDDLEQVLQSLWAPLSTWHSCALEYYRQGMFPEFEHVLSEVNEAINSSEVDTDVLQRYKEMSHFNEGNLLIIQTLAADVVMKYNRPLNSDKENKALAEKFSEYIQQLLRIDHFNLVTSLLRGFFSIKEREFKKALTYFRTVEASKSAKNFRQCLFASYLGHGTIEYFNKHFNDALKFFTSAIELYPDSPCGVRVAFAVCCFELQQFDRARAAIDRALYIDPTSVDALLMLALLERVDAHKFKARRAEHYANAYEYCMLVANMDKGNAMAWNHIAQYLFFSWKLVSESASIQDPTTLVMTIVGESNLAVGDIVRIGGGDFSARVKEMVRQGPSSISITLNQPLPSELPRNHSKLRIECKELTYIKTILMKALKCSRVSEVNAESSYLLGRLFQYIGNLDTAVKHFEDCLKKWPDMPLAAFSLGQILLSRQDHTKALALFEGVHAKYPEDRDSQAFIILLNSITKSELYPFDKLREVVTGFVFEADVWQIQGYLRHSRSQDASKGEDITLALRCYEMSMAAMRKQNSAVPSRFLSNLGVLYHSTGSLDTALVYIRDAILTAPSFDMTDILVSSKVFCHDELFFLNAHCSEEDQMMFRVNHDCTLSPVHNENGENLQTCPDLSTRYSLGDILICDDLVSSFVTAVSPGSISVRTQDGYAKLEAKGSTIKTRHVTCGGLVTDRTLTFCFNYARVLEDMMAFNAAAELYKELLTMHPAYWECKLRLGCIAKSKGQFQEALTLFAQALEFVGSETAGVVHCYMGEIQRSLRQHELAKKAFEKDRTPRGELHMANFYFSAIYTSQNTPGPKFDETLKHSYKYYFDVLTKDKFRENMFASNGLGMVLAEKGEYEAAREIFTKIREVGTISEAFSASINLAHICLYQERFSDAIHLYYTALKSNKSDVELLQYLALAQFKSKLFEDSMISLQRALFIQPTSPVLIYNLSYLRQEFALSILNKKLKSVKEIRIALDELNAAKKAFGSLKHVMATSVDKTRACLKPDLIPALEAFCADNIIRAAKHLAMAESEEEKARSILEEQERLHREQMEQLRSKLQEEAELREKAKRELQEKAQEKAKQLELLRSSWAVVEAAPEKKLKGAGRKRKGDGDESESSGEDDEGKGSDDAKKGKRDKKGKGKKRKKLDIMAAVYDSDAGSSDKDKGKGSEDDERPELYDSDEDENRGAETKQGAKEEEEGSSPATKPEAPSLPTKGGGLLRRAERVESDDEEEMDFESTAGASLPEASTDDPALLNDEKLPAIRPSVDTDKALRTLRRIDDDE